ncbi:hypothetical protein AVEN_159362-1, partial [Araneus ventricosus]
MAADVKGQNNWRLVIHDRPSGLNFLVETGADISVVPPSSTERCKSKSLLNLLSANCTKMKKPILGADFLTHNGIIIDLKSKSPQDQETTLNSIGKISTDNTPIDNFMTLGLRNSAQTIQRLMDNALQGLDFYFVHTNDLFIASSSLEEHLDHLKQVFLPATKI